MPREDVGVGFEARRIVGDLNASVANGDAFQTTPLERRPLVVIDKIHEGADETYAGGVYGVAECAGQPGSTFLRGPWHGAVTQTEPHAFDRHAKAISSEHRHHGVGAAPDIGRAAAHEGRSISPYRCDGFAWGLIRAQCPSCHAVSDELPPVPHRPRLWSARRPAEALGALSIAVEQRVARPRQARVRMHVRVILHPQLDGIDAQRVRELVDGRLQGERAFGFSGCTHPARCRNALANLSRACRHIGARVRVGSPVRDQIDQLACPCRSRISRRVQWRRAVRRGSRRSTPAESCLADGRPR